MTHPTLPNPTSRFAARLARLPEAVDRAERLLARKHHHEATAAAIAVAYEAEAETLRHEVSERADKVRVGVGADAGERTRTLAAAEAESARRFAAWLASAVEPAALKRARSLVGR